MIQSKFLFSGNIARDDKNKEYGTSERVKEQMDIKGNVVNDT